jgi:acetyl-CoA C-acetyltransferase
MTVDPRSPCIVGVAQRTVRPGPGVESPEPLVLWEEMGRSAARDSGRASLLDHLDTLKVVYTQSWQYDDPPGRLAARLGVGPPDRLYSGIGGTTPQVLVGEAADAIREGRSEVALVVGAEALYTRRKLKKEGRRPEWSFKDPERKPFPFEAPFLPAEVAHGVFQAWLTFPVFDIARRARLGIEPGEYREQLGRLMAPMTQVAAANPHAWFPTRRTVEELIRPTPDNRMVGYPYTKYMVSVMDVDMAAAVALCSHAKAEELGIPRDRRVYLHGWCYATDVTYVAERQDMWESPAMRAASSSALSAAGADIDAVAHLDLYSCFASSLNLAIDALGISPDDPRPLTVTGGLPFFGGAGSDYMLHSIATMAGRLRSDPGSLGLVSGVGMHMTKHVFGVYGTEPPGQAGYPERERVQARLDSLPRRRVRDTYTGPVEVAAYTIAHARRGEPEWGLVIADLPGGDRCYARIEDPALLLAAEENELVGETLEVVATGGNVNVVKA